MVEDNPTDVFLITEALAAYHIEVDLQVVEDGEAGVNLVDRLEADDSIPCPKLILLDINLPKRDGFAVLEHIRQSHRSQRIPVVVMTSSSAESDRTKAWSLGASAIFEKPTDYLAFLKLGELIEPLLRG